MNLVEFAKLKFFKKEDEFKSSLNEETVHQLEKFQQILTQINSDINAPGSVFRYIHTNAMVAGGAIRDTVLGKSNQVKDVDVFFSLDFVEDFDDKPNPMSRSDFFQRLVDAKIIEKDNKENDSDLILKALVHQLKDKYEILAVLNTQDEMPIKPNYITNSAFEHDYCTKDINGVIKLKHPEIDYPIDLIISLASIQHIIKEIFDFNLCKVYLQHGYGDKKVLNNLYYDPSFLTDIQDKTITLAIADQTLNKTSIEKHLPRLIKKYPDYRVICQSLNEENEILLEKVIFDHKFGHDEKNNSQDKKKVKM